MFCRHVAAIAAFLILHPAPALAESLRPGGKLLLTNGVTSLEGAAGGGLTPWAVIAGNETRDGIGLSAHGSAAFVKDYAYRSAGISVGLFDRVELSFARQEFDTGRIGAALGLGRGYDFRQDIAGAKVRLAGDLVYDRLPAIVVGGQYKRSGNDAVVRAVGARRDEDVDLYVSASRLFLSRSILVSGTARLTRGNQMGLLGYGGDRRGGRTMQLEGSMAWQMSRRFAVGGEYRMKPDNLGIAREDDWFDLFAAWAVTPNITASAAYVDLGSIATAKGQRGIFLQLQASY